MTLSIAEAYQYCKDLTERSGPHFSVGFRFLPPEKREAIYAVYAFCRYADDVVDEQQDQPVPDMLQSWEDELDRCYEGIPTHPITIALADATKRYPIPKAGFQGLIEGCRMDLEINRYPTFEALMVYVDRVATTIRDLSLPVFGYQNPKGRVCGRALSTALQMTNVIRDVGEDLGRDRIYLPQDEIRASGYSEEELIGKVKNDAFLRMVGFQCCRIRDYFDQAAQLIPIVEADSQLAVSLMRNVYVAIIDQIEKNPFDIFDRQIRLPLVVRGKVITQTLLERGESYSIPPLP